MTKSKIRPPRKPRGEDPKVTIANQEKQIELLIARCQNLHKENNELAESLRVEQATLHVSRDLCDQHRNRYESLQQVQTRMLGWQDCAREMLELKHPRIIPPEFREVE